jgi:hypothetical protein
MLSIRIMRGLALAFVIVVAAAVLTVLLSCSSHAQLAPRDGTATCLRVR